MKTTKKILSLLLVVISALSCFAISANAATTYTSGNYEYTVNNGNATITKYTGTSSSVSIPSTLGGYTVNKIGDSSFKGNSTLTSVSIPSTVTTITEYTNNSTGYGAFENCPKLQTVTIAAGSKDAKIGSYTFNGDKSLTTVHIPSNYVNIYKGAFSGCSNVTICNTTSDCYAKTYADANGISFKICSGGHGTPTTTNCTVTFNGNGGTVSPTSKTVTKGTSITLPTPYSRTGYTCLGWSTSSSATTATYSCGASYTVNGNVTLYAVWKYNAPSTYTLSYNANGGSGAPSNQTGSTSYTISSTVPKYFPKTFLGWSKSSSASSATYVPGDTISLSQNTTLYAVWKSASTLSTSSSTSVTVGFSDQAWYYKFTPSISGTYKFESTGSADSKAYLYNSSGSELTSNDDGGTNSNFKLEYNLTSGTTYYLAFRCYGSKTGSYTVNVTSPVTVSCTVNFNGNGGTVSPESKTVTKGTSITLPIPARSGYTCLGWSTSSSAASATYSCNTSYTVNGNVTLYAVWKETKPDDSIEIDYKDTYTLGYYGFNPVSYYSDNPSVASVSQDGVIYGASRGRTYVHAVDFYGNERVTEVNVTYTVVQWIIVIVLFGWIWY